MSITKRPDGYYWTDPEDGSEYGPFSTLLEAGKKRGTMRRKRPPKRSPAARSRPELNQASRALLGADEEKRPYRPRADDASIEDPLEDWPQDN